MKILKVVPSKVSAHGQKWLRRELNGDDSIRGCKTRIQWELVTRSGDDDRIQVNGSFPLNGLSTKDTCRKNVEAWLGFV